MHIERQAKVCDRGFSDYSGGLKEGPRTRSPKSGEEASGNFHHFRCTSHSDILGKTVTKKVARKVNQRYGRVAA